MKKLSRSVFDLPTYPVKILQFGNGNFLRGFADWMVQIANNQGLMQASIQVVQIHSKQADPRIAAQEGLYHVVERGKYQGKLIDQSLLISCIADVNVAAEDYSAYLRIGENPDLKIVFSNTTEAGIQFDPKDLRTGEAPITFPGKLTELLFHRWTFFEGNPTKGLIFLPCELIERNGFQLRASILNYAESWNLPSDFAAWIKSSNTFCNTLVDRIVPGFPQSVKSEIEEQLGFQDELVVMVEPFHLWVIEGPEQLKMDFPLDKAGLNVKFVRDLTPYRTMKVRILNGAHTTLVPYAYLHGLRTVKEAVEHPVMEKFLRQAIFNEIIPTLDLPRTELDEFAKDVLERFSNPFIRHELKSIALNSVSKFKVRVLPSLLSFYEKEKRLPDGLCKGFAALMIFYSGSFQGEELPVSDETTVVEFFRQAWKRDKLEDTIKEILSNHQLWETDLSILPGLASALEAEISGMLI